MKTATPELIAMLASSTQFWMADCYTFTLVDGTVLRYTSADFSVVFGGNTYLHTGPLFKRGRTRCSVGLSVDSMEINVTASSDHTLAGLPFIQAVANGLLDGATVELDRAFAATPGAAVVGTVKQFVGLVSNADPKGFTAKIMVRSHLELLNVSMPRNLYQPPCGNTIYDANCGVSRAAHAAYSAIASGSTRRVLNCGLANAAGFFDIGEVVMTSGQNTGLRRTVRSYSPGVVSLAYPLPKDVANGDTFTIYPGCDRRLTTCDTKFGNKPRFRGTPFVPVPETAL